MRNGFYADCSAVCKLVQTCATPTSARPAVMSSLCYAEAEHKIVTIQFIVSAYSRLLVACTTPCNNLFIYVQNLAIYSQDESDPVSCK